MMLSGGTWALLVLGVLFTQRWTFLRRLNDVVGPAVIGLALLAEVGRHIVAEETSPHARFTAALALCGFIAWAVTLRHQPGLRHWGGVAWALGGMLALGQSHDLLLLGLAWEIVRHGVRMTAIEHPRDHQANSQWLLSLGWWTAIAGLLLFGGTTDLDALIRLARQLYTPMNQAEPLGRASLLLVGAMALLIVTVCGAMLLPTPAEHRDDAEPRQIAACGRLHLQWAAGLVLAAVFQTGCPGVTGPITVLMTVMIIATWTMAVMTLGRTQRWCELADAAVRFQGGAILFVTWLLLAQIPNPTVMQGTLLSSAPISFVWGQELLHGAVAITALLAALSWRSDHGLSTDFIEASRGAATTSPWQTLWLLLPLASLIGFPGLWGGWTRLATGAAVLSVQSMREDELAIPIGSIIVVAAAGLFVVGFLIRGTIHIVSVLCWEPLIGRPRPPGNGWPQIIAATVSFGLLITGCCPAIATMMWQWFVFSSVE